MENMFIKQTKYTPLILFDADNHTLEIRGESYPEDTSIFYTPVFRWLETYLAEFSGKQTITLNMEMIYYNSNSSRSLMNILDMLQDASMDGKKIVINWYYHKDNEMALENGEEFREDLESLTFNLVRTGG